MNSQHINLAQELHDGIAQDLVGLGYSIDSLIAEQINPTHRSQLRALRLGVSGLIDKVRKEIFELRNTQSLVDSDASIDPMFEIQRIFNEILRNIDQHSKASKFEFTIIDNGIGGVEVKPGSFGLVGLQERVSKLNGDIQIESTDKGTRIHLMIPLDR